jgi:hypothetical protein
MSIEIAINPIPVTKNLACLDFGTFGIIETAVPLTVMLIGPPNPVSTVIPAPVRKTKFQKQFGSSSPFITPPPIYKYCHKQLSQKA